jgi:bifunctional DNase/RNase
MQKIKLEVNNIEYSQTHSGSYVLTLAETNGVRNLPIVIGSFEAQAIAVELEKMVPNRPLTHDLFKSSLNAFKITVLEVMIHQFKEGIFYANIVCEQENQRVEIDARSSDAVAIALRFNAPIFTNDQVMDEVSNSHERTERMDLEDEFSNEEDEDIAEEHSFDSEALDTLEKQLEQALENEDYELASKIRDEINKRKK